MENYIEDSMTPRLRGSIKGSLILREQALARRIEYDEKPNTCIECLAKLTFEKRKRSFCSHRCVSIHSNRLRRESKIEENKFCEQCGSILKKNQNKFCSRKCHGFNKRHPIKDCIPIVAGRKVKKLLIAEHGEVCMDPECAWDFSKRKVRVELHHLDGNHSNNELSNLMLLCPGCHSLTRTYGSKNIGRGRHHRRKKALLEAHGVSL